MDFLGMNKWRARVRAHSNLPRLKPEGLKRGSFRSAEALLPRINAGAPTTLSRRYLPLHNFRLLVYK